MKLIRPRKISSSRSLNNIISINMISSTPILEKVRYKVCEIMIDVIEVITNDDYIGMVRR